MTHAGNSYTSSVRSADPRLGRARARRASCTAAAAAARRRATRAPVVSVGSTPTALFGESFEGVTEVRAGVYMFFDLVMAGLGVCRVEDLALSVLATVIGHQAEKGWIITDAGLDGDVARPRHGQPGGRPGLRPRRATSRVEPSATSSSCDTNQEHGIIARRGGAPARLEDFPVGTLLRIFPNHACATGAQHDAYHVVNAGTVVESRWERFNGW